MAADDDRLAYLLKICEGARTLAQIEQKCLFLYTDKIEFDPTALKKVLHKADAAEHLAQTRDALAELETWGEQSLNKTIEDLCTKNQVGMGKIAQPIRVAITGTMISPSIHESLILLGKEKTLKRIDDTLEYLRIVGS